MALRNGKHLSIISSVFLLSGGIPILMVMLMIYIISHYWIEKYLSKFLCKLMLIVLRKCKVPHNYETELNDRALNIINFSVILHCSVNMFLFSNSDMLNLDFILHPNQTI